MLIRDPKEMLPSYAKIIENPTIKDVGYALHIELVDYHKKIGINPIIIDSKKILTNPKIALIHLCELLNISFQEKMLKWKKGGRIEDGVWAKYWYNNVHNSIGFQKYKQKKEPFPTKLKPLLKSCIPHYNRLLKLSII